MDMLDDEVCNKIGRPFIRAEENPKHIPYYPLENIVFYSYIPFLRDRVMSREFEFLIMDLELNFLYSDFIRQFLSEFSAKWRLSEMGRVGWGRGLVYTFPIGTCSGRSHIVECILNFFIIFFFPSIK